MTINLEALAEGVRDEVLSDIRGDAPMVSCIVILADMSGNPAAIGWASDLNREATKELLEACVWRCVPSQGDA